MYKYLTLSIQNHHLFRKARFDLDYKGVSVILGDNRDANAGSTNAAGKSSFFTEIAELAVDQSSLAGKAGKISPDGRVYLKVQKEKDTWEFLRKNKGGRDVILIKKNGEDQDVRRKGRAQEIIQSVLQRTPEEFFSLDCIDSQRPHDLHRGSTAQRRDFIISMFGLENVDNLRKLFAAELRRIAENRSAYEEVKRQYKSLSEQLVDESEVELAVTVERLEKSYKKISDRVNLASEIRNLIEFRDENKSNIEAMTKLLGDSTLEEVLKQKKKKLRKLESQLQIILAWDKYNERLAEYNAVKKKAKQIIGEITKEEAEVGYEKFIEYEKQIHHIEATLAKLKQELPAKEELNETHKRYVGNPERLEALWSENRALFVQLTELLGVTEKHTDGKDVKTCPVCGSKTSTLIVSDLNRRLESTKSKQKAISECREVVRRVTRRTEILKEARQLSGQLERYRTALAEARGRYNAKRVYDRLPESPNRPVEVSDGDAGSMSEVEARDKIKKVVRTIDFLERIQPIEAKLHRCQTITAEEKQESDNLEVLRAKLNEIVNVLPKKRSALDKMQIVKREMAELRSRGMELKDSVADEEAYRLLVEAYGNAGIKKLMLQRIGQHLQGCFNKYARFVFSESYRFKVNIDTQFDILVQRRYPGRKMVSDVRRLSGAESRAFALLLWLSLLSLTPSSKRSNLLILDEPDANLGPEMRENFIKFLPVLNKIVPHIIIISPHLYAYPDARYFTVVKKNGWSTIVEGNTHADSK
jgi:DNA repair exonuclease SbcCD ATPase subunit